ncbi:hypothetical protein OCU04_001777 [Sclerotinia nivalis]|uniref:Uncharacterized protein n=1 Tax=Sclerotinia nivalis TaxID=352851 RepID=A0A9X0AYT6_9HELO|nr:hypothetical protein OCU04_001777 [Sclerotinia nivalis]
MINPQKFNIINPKRVSSDALYEEGDLVPIWRKCLRYRPRFKDLRAFNPLRDKIRQIPGCVRRIWSPSPSGVRGKHAVSSRYVETKPNTFLDALQREMIIEGKKANTDVSH